MGVVAAHRATVSPHGNRLQAHPLISAQIADQMAIIGMQCSIFCQIEIIAVFHVESRARA